MLPDRENEAVPAPNRKEITQPDFSGEPRPVGELTVKEGFPQCALGVYIDIRGFAGVVVEIVNQSIKVRSPEGITQRFNANRLKTLHAPPDRSEPVPMVMVERPRHRPAPETDRPGIELPPRVFIANPDFTAPVRPIEEFAGQSEFPACVYGRHIDILGYTGVVVEIVNGSLKVQSPTGITRGYNAGVLKKLHGAVVKRS